MSKYRSAKIVVEVLYCLLMPTFRWVYTSMYPQKVALCYCAKEQEDIQENFRFK